MTPGCRPPASRRGTGVSVEFVTQLSGLTGTRLEPGGASGLPTEGLAVHTDGPTTAGCVGADAALGQCPLQGSASCVSPGMGALALALRASLRGGAGSVVSCTARTRPGRSPPLPTLSCSSECDGTQRPERGSPPWY